MAELAEHDDDPFLNRARAEGSAAGGAGDSDSEVRRVATTPGSGWGNDVSNSGREVAGQGGHRVELLNLAAKIPRRNGGSDCRLGGRALLGGVGPQGVRAVQKQGPAQGGRGVDVPVPLAYLCFFFFFFAGG